MELTKEDKLALIENRIAQWNANAYSLELDAKVARVIEDEQMLERVKASLKKALGALEVLQTELDALQTE